MTIKIKIWANKVPKSKSRQIYLKICPLANWKVLDTNLPELFKDFRSKI